MRVTRLANMAYDYKNKVILITGGAGGIGSHLAREFSAQGARMNHRLPIERKAEA